MSGLARAPKTGSLCRQTSQPTADPARARSRAHGASMSSDRSCTLFINTIMVDEPILEGESRTRVRQPSGIALFINH